MKTKKAIDLCKKTGVLNIYCDKDVQWISNGAAIYSLWGLPELDEISVCLAYDIDGKKAEKMTIKRYPELPDTLNLEDNTPTEAQLEEYTKFGLRYMGRDLRALIAKDGVIFIDKAYLSPLSDIPYEDLFYFARTDKSGQTYIAVKQGLEIVAAVYPVRVIEESFVAEINTFAQLCETTFDIMNFKKGGDGLCG